MPYYHLTAVALAPSCGPGANDETSRIGRDQAAAGDGRHQCAERCVCDIHVTVEELDQLMISYVIFNQFLRCSKCMKKSSRILPYFATTELKLVYSITMTCILVTYNGGRLSAMAMDHWQWISARGATESSERIMRYGLREFSTAEFLTNANRLISHKS